MSGDGKILAVTDALAAVYPHATRDEAVALIDALEDQGLCLVRTAVPVVGTKRLVKKRSGG